MARVGTCWLVFARVGSCLARVGSCWLVLARVGSCLARVWLVLRYSQDHNKLSDLENAYLFFSNERLPLLKI